MRYLDEYRDGANARIIAEAIRRAATRPWTLMEICGGQTHSIVRFGIDRLLPEPIRLVHGPGCPVCVTPVGLIDAAIGIASRSGCTLCSFGDMLRVPGSQTDMLRTRARGADVRTVLSPLEAVQIAEGEPDREVVFFAVGFETTAPANALAVKLAAARRVPNFSLLVAHVRVPPAIEAILSSPGNTVQGFLAAGHVCAVVGTSEYESIASRFQVPIVVTGFEPTDLLLGVLRNVLQLEEGRHDVENAYGRVVRERGNEAALSAVAEVFEVSDREWRGIGTITASGMRLAAGFRQFDALERFGVEPCAGQDDRACAASEVLRGRIEPSACPEFGKRCTPESPLGAPMVSSEGACAAYFRYRAGVS